MITKTALMLKEANAWMGPLARESAEARAIMAKHRGKDGGDTQAMIKELQDHIFSDEKLKGKYGKHFGAEFGSTIAPKPQVHPKPGNASVFSPEAQAAWKTFKEKAQKAGNQARAFYAGNKTRVGAAGVGLAAAGAGYGAYRLFKHFNQNRSKVQQ